MKSTLAPASSLHGRVLPLFAALILAACTSAPPPEVDDAPAIPGPRREFRAAWVATVANIDWPSRPDLSVAAQQEEARALLDRLVALNMNAVVFQVRPHGDALYDSALEPWSSYLTGAQGRPPSPFYDPLQFWITEAKKRGLQLHAWFNPYRASHPSNRGSLAETSLVKSRPDLVVKLGSKGYYWMDPAKKEVQDHCVAVVMDVVKRYDVDGVHFDDYFYPYTSYNDGQDFPDDATYAQYQRDGGQLARGPWRRAAVDSLIERLHREIRQTKPWVEFGISPFGIWRPNHPTGIEGLDQFAVLYADARRWWREGWVDYLTPQLYWPIARVAQSFPVLLGWWKGENVTGRHLWPGTSVARTQGPAGATELANQIMITRGMLPTDPGMCLFSMKWLMKEGPVVEALKEGPYKSQALIPSSPWIDEEAPLAPTVTAQRAGNALRIAWTTTTPSDVFLWVVAVRQKDRWSHRIVPADVGSLEWADARNVDAVCVTAVDRSRNESRKRLVSIDPTTPVATTTMALR